MMQPSDIKIIGVVILFSFSLAAGKQLIGWLQRDESMKHGRAEMPWGKYKGVRIRLIPDNYLSWLTSTDIIVSPRWKWLKDSLMAELRYRGLRDDLASTSDPEPVKQPLPLVTIGSTRRNIILEE
jgi:uncharacterized protein (DUF3820 family)